MSLIEMIFNSVQSSRLLFLETQNQDFVVSLIYCGKSVSFLRCINHKPLINCSIVNRNINII